MSNADAIDWNDDQGGLAWSKALGVLSDKTEVEALFRGVFGPMSELAISKRRMVYFRKLDNAFGKTLDYIASIVGVDRSLPEGLSLLFFGYQDQPNAGSFGEAPIRDHFERDTAAYLLPDAELRRVIKAKIILNTSFGSIEDIIASAKLLFNTDLIRVTIPAPMRVHIEVGVVFNNTQPLFYVLDDLLPIPGGRTFTFHALEA